MIDIIEERECGKYDDELLKGMCYIKSRSKINCYFNSFYFEKYFRLTVSSNSCHSTVWFSYLNILANISDLEINSNVTCNTCDSNQLSAFDHYLVKWNDRNSNTRNNNPVLFMHLQHDTQIYNSTQNFSWTVFEFDQIYSKWNTISFDINKLSSFNATSYFTTNSF